MSKFKVGDKVALKDNPYDFLGYVANFVAGCQLYYLIAMKDNKYRIARESEIVALQELPNMSDDEIYKMLKPKLANMCMRTEYHKVLPTVFELEFEPQNDYNPYIPESDAIKAIALAYRSGYLRAKKGRPFKIGGEKE